ncbi:ABC transporter ATP-binding protein [Saccharospirillum sp.]|uniref:ABC transporter ATP-binding protein n=1 Tax=Saccharospirillum sp. TaxID=2033801 RepID=UPI0034A018AA
MTLFTAKQPSFEQPGAATNPVPALELRNVAHCYSEGALAVSDVSLSLRSGEVVCLLGPSGCGKTTLLRLVAGLEALQTGEIHIEGELKARGGGQQTPPEKRNVGLAFQDSALFPHLTVLDNVTFGLRHLSAIKRQERGMSLLGKLGMANHATSFPHLLSGGQQQRVALARALAPAPQVMLLDEPFSSLDSRLRDQIRDDTLHVLKSVNAATLLVTHDPEEAMFMADRIFLMRDGKLVQAGTPTELYTQPKTPFVATFFGTVNELDGVVCNGHVATPAGRVATPNLEEATAVSVYIRPEALTVKPIGSPTEEDHHRHSHVLMSRLLGPVSLIHLCAHSTGSTTEVHLHARVPGVFLPTPGQPVRLELNPDLVFVFPRYPAAVSGERAE